MILNFILKVIGDPEGMIKGITRGGKTCSHPSKSRRILGHQRSAGHSVKDINDDKIRQIQKLE